jgi:hypothetical protein
MKVGQQYFNLILTLLVSTFNGEGRLWGVTADKQLTVQFYCDY